ncbi:MAG: RCC1 domain-containing protein [Myxococcota bacterium]
MPSDANTAETNGSSVGSSIPSIRAMEVEVGREQVCARTEKGQLHCSGGSSWGPSLLSQVLLQPSTLLVRVEDLEQVDDVALGAELGCAVANHRERRGVFCWLATPGEDAVEVDEKGPTPAQLPLPEDVSADIVEIAAGRSHFCARTATRTVWCWDDMAQEEHVPREAEGLRGALRLTMSEGALCAKLPAEVRCLEGTPLLGKLCEPDDEGHACIDLEETREFRFSAQNACRVDAGDTLGQLVCAGDNRFGVVLPALASDVELDWTPLDPGFSTLETSLGDSHACALGNDMRVRCWGKNRGYATGQPGAVGVPCGDGDRCHGPLVVPMLPDTLSLAGSGEESCAVVVDGTVWCWGTRYGDAGRPPHPMILQ